MKKKYLFILITLLLACNSKYDSQSLVEKGKELLIENDFDNAFKNFSTAIKKDPKNAEAYYYLADVYASKEEYSSAISQLNKVIELDSLFQFVYTKRGITYRKIGKLDLALADFSKEISLFPKEVEALNERGLVY